MLLRPLANRALHAVQPFGTKHVHVVVTGQVAARLDLGGPKLQVFGHRLVVMLSVDVNEIELGRREQLGGLGRGQPVQFASRAKTCGAALCLGEAPIVLELIDVIDVDIG